MAHSGDRCNCGGYVRVRSSDRRGESQVKYLECAKCGISHGKEVVPADSVRRRCL